MEHDEYLTCEKIGVKFHIARTEKPYCGNCGEPIKKGQKYVIEAGRIDGQVSVINFHRECWR